LKFTTTNNEAEYEAIIAGMDMAREIGVRNLEVRSNSQVVIGHIKGEVEA
jgi:ribonuclease HI